MTNLDRLERRLPDLMAELSPPRVPDYFDDMLQATARARQRPAWASLERWLPVELTARPAPFGLTSWRPVLTMLVIVALLVATGAVLIAGSKRALPPLFGPAGNGAVIYSTDGGDILSLDPATGKAVTIVGGPSDDRYPTVSPDGQRVVFLRIEDPAMIYVANIDGSGSQAIATATEASWNEFSPDGQRLIYIVEGGGTPFVRDVATGTTRPLQVPSAVNQAQWLADGQLLLIKDVEPNAASGSGASRQFWTINADGTNLQTLTTPDACCAANVLAGSGLFTWTSWGLFPNTHGRIHIFDTRSGIDRMLASTDKPGLLFLDARFSPDGKWLFVHQYGGSVTGVQPALIAADGSGEFIKLGPELQKVGGEVPEVRATFSPDGTQLLITYDDGSAWLYAVPGGQGSKVDWTGVVDTSWQRLALQQ